MPPASSIHADVVVLCPMQVERTHIERQLRQAGLHHVRVVQTGIGKDAILQHVRSCSHQSPRLLILAGACGGLQHIEDVPPIARIIDEHGHTWVPPVPPRPGTSVALVAVDRIISTPADKRILAANTGAAIVDMESHAFAALCEELKLRYAVVRGVSDTPDETLPHEVLAWISPEGNTRTARAIWDLIRKPWLLPHVLGVVRRSNRVLPQVGRAVVELVNAERAKTSTASNEPLRPSERLASAPTP